MSAEVGLHYKQSELGLIPAEWTVKHISDCMRLINGRAFKPSEWASSGVPIIRIQNLNNPSADFNYYPFDDIEDRHRIKPGDLVFAWSGTLGSSFGARSWAGPEGVLNQHIFKVIPDAKVISPEYALIVFKRIEDDIAKKAHGFKTSFVHIKKADLDSTFLPLPCHHEQKAIALALNDIEDMISSLEQLIAKKRDIHQATMQQLLTGQRRLPGFSGEWVTKSLMEIAESKKALFDDGDWVEAEHITDQGVRLIQTGNIGVGCFVEKTNRKYIYEESFESLKCKELKVGDILICRLAEPAGRACIFPDIGENKVITSVDVTIFRPRPEVANRNFLVQIFSTGGWFKSVLDQVGGTTHKRISRGALGRIKISLPHVDEQTAIATILSDMDAELAALEARRDKARQLKQGMMQELLTGRIRLLNGTDATKGEMVT